jgi:hypothetical protein
MIHPPTPALQLAQALLTLTFDKVPRGGPAPVVLSSDQQTALQALSACDAIWHYDGNMYWLLEEPSLPGTRTELTAYLASHGG